MILPGRSCFQTPSTITSLVGRRAALHAPGPQNHRVRTAHRLRRGESPNRAQPGSASVALDSTSALAGMSRWLGCGTIPGRGASRHEVDLGADGGHARLETLACGRGERDDRTSLH